MSHVDTGIHRLGELFCGPGGMALGAYSAEATKGRAKLSVRHVWATDYDEDSCNTFRDNIVPNNPDSVICDDIRKLDYKILKGFSEIDGLAFGFPCNDFSVVGEQKGINGKFGPLYTYGVKALHYFRPLWFLAENVSGLQNSNEGVAFQTILEELQEAGYKLYPHKYLFERYGVPQARHRVIIVGLRDDLDVEFKIPSPVPFEKNDVSAGNALLNPPIPQEASNQEETKHAPNVIERLKHIKPGENAFTADLPKHLRLNVKGARISQIYKRLDLNKPAYTVTGSGGGGTHVYHWSENRALTNRERARLQTFPDSFVFSGSKESVRKQIGMAVPPKGVQVIFEAILKSFLGVDYPSIEPNIGFMKRLLDTKGMYEL